MGENWAGKAVSIHCTGEIGVFQGTIKDANSSKIVITKAFRNGLPIKSLDTEVTIMAIDIAKIELIPQQNVTNVHSGVQLNASENVKLYRNKSPTNINQKHARAAAKSPGANVRNIFANFIPSKVEVKMAHGTGSTASNGYPANYSRNTNAAPSNIDASLVNGANTNNKFIGQFQAATISTPIQNKNDKRNKTRQAFNKNTFATPVNDPVMDEEFDFEKNLALFDKQAIWDEIEQKPDVVRQTGFVKKKNYRHDENILDSKPVGFRQIKVKYQCQQEYVTDEGILIPSLTMELRSRILLQAELHGFSWERQCDMLSRGTVELAMQLLGGARRLSVKNQHQWPKIAIICDELFRDRHSDIGFSTGRQLAAQGLSVYVYLSPSKKDVDQKINREMELFMLTGNQIIHRTDEFPYCDLVIMATQNNIRNHNVVKWINDNRSPVMAVDPPAGGIPNINIKCSILPLLPLENIHSMCGKLYLCNLSIPDSVFKDAGITYKSPYGHKFIIPLHLVNDNN